MKAHCKVILIAAFIFIVAILGCEQDHDNKSAQPLEINGTMTSHTECKPFKLAQDEAIPDSMSCARYGYDPLNNTLTIMHLNAEFNCCPDSLYCKIFASNDTIFIKEIEKGGMCNCLCLYDLTIEVTNVTPQKYTVKFTEPYVGEQESLLFEIDLMQNTSGTYCIKRIQHPW